jgi:hypothetical protein
MISSVYGSFFVFPLVEHAVALFSACSERENNALK